ncbi:uncharacterized protein LOC125947742 [Dermacentor silvarum]|uniref:uncharacterized protein LOC125947742 n=1 Tax=Dermacentor silvarum TaxID=543639 RepID=UPI00210124F5|nr:uncharacterized protein LOC125947742 [Dermacentor silvarum]
MSSAGECVGSGPPPEPPEAFSTSLMAPVHVIVDIFAILLVGKAQGLSYILAQEARNDTTTYLATIYFIRGMLATYPALTLVAIVIALLNLIPGILMFLSNSTSDLEDALDEELSGTERCHLAVLRGSMAVLLVVLGGLLASAFAANSMYSDHIFRLPEHADRFRGILAAYEDDVHNVRTCAFLPGFATTVPQ